MLRRPPDGRNALTNLYTDNQTNLPTSTLTQQLWLMAQFGIMCGPIKNWLMQIFHLPYLAKHVDFSRKKATHNVVSNSFEPTVTNTKHALIFSAESMKVHRQLKHITEFTKI